MPPHWTPADLLPGALVLAAGAALLWALRRWYDPVPWRPAAAFAVVLAALFAPVLAGGEVLLPLGNLRESPPYRHLPPPAQPSVGLQGDLVTQILPWQAQARRAVEAGRWPLWNEHAGAGMPLMGDPQAQAFQPLVVVTHALSLPQAPAATSALRVAFALFGTFLLLRRQGLGEVAATFGGLAWGCGGAVLLWLGWPLATSYALAPFALYALARCHQVGGRRDAALLGAVLVTLLLGGHPETILYALAAVGLSLLGCLLERRRAALPLLPLAGRVAAAGALALAVASPVLLPVQQFLPATERYEAIAHLRAGVPLASIWSELRKPQVLASWAERAEGDLSPFAAPRARGSFEDGYWGPRNYFEDAAGFVGTATLALALAGLFPARRRFRQERLAQAAGLAALLLVAQPPGFDRLLGPLPILGGTATHQNHRLVGFLGLALVCLAACELERWRRGDRRLPAGLAAGAAVAAVVAWAYRAHPRPHGGEGLYFLEAAWLGRQLLALALVLAALGFAAWAARRGSRWAAGAASVALLVAAAELLALHGSAVRGAPPRLFYPRTPPVRFLAQNLGEHRFAGLDAVMPPNFAQVLPLRDIRIDGPSRPAAYGRVLSALQAAPGLPVPLLYFVDKADHPVHDLLGVRYVLAPRGARLELALALRHRGGFVYARPGALPRLFLPARAETLPPGADWVAWVAANPSFATRALVSQGRPRSASGTAGGEPPAPRWRARRHAASSLEVELREPERLAAEARLAEPRLLASSVLADAGWRLLLDGEPRPTVLANGPFVGAWLPEGSRRVELLYRPPGFLAACLAAAAALAAALCALVRPPRSPRDAAVAAPAARALRDPAG